MSVVKNAWKVPNSEMLITVNKIPTYYESYNCGIMFEKDNYNISITNGENVYTAIEKLIYEINGIADTWWSTFQLMKKDAEIKEITDWWNLPCKGFNFNRECLKSIIEINHKFKDYKIKNIFLKTKIYEKNKLQETNKYCACIVCENNDYKFELFKAEPSSDKNIAFQNLINTILGVGANLEKIQNGAWNALIDNNNPGYEIKKNKFYQSIIEKIGK
jgi:hypothetical protein